ncbi:SMI1/KNR4 family protein [Actinoplanes sp. HUAS TT8]|uniref:SMI1/KNR4 family protein n=1 Tax=Actinoplanes sp. HUAS TT8 TaxID=3447453 RepID=UPI003F522F73
MPGQVTTLWHDIAEWLRQNAPASASEIRPPASDALIAQVEAEIGRPLPADLREWWQQSDGVEEPELAFLLPPGFAPLSCREALSQRAMSLEITASSPSGGPPIDEAGDERAADFHPLFLPIGTDTLGNTLCADLRDGRRHGCVGEWNHEAGWDDALRWENVAAMLADVRAALVDGRPALADYASRRGQRFAGRDVDTPVFSAEVTDDGELEWTDEEP